jgi:RNA polymerase primary sigma factor
MPGMRPMSAVADPVVSMPLNRLLRLASMAGVDTAVQLHIARGDDLDARDGGGLTPLMLAAKYNRATICRLLLNAGAIPDLTNLSGFSAYFSLTMVR